MDLNVEERTIFKKFDVNLIFVILALNIIGLINLYSATHDAQSTGLHRVFLTQVVWLAGGWLLFMLISIVDYKIISKLAWVIYLANVGALAAVHMVGSSFYGAKRWLDFGAFSFQPSETMKVALVIILAKIFADKSYPDGLSIKNIIYPLVITVIPFALTVKQPDLGTALLLLAIAGSMILFLGVKKYLVIGTLISAIVILPVAWNFGMKDYQKRRVLTFMDPNKDPRGAGYNSIQSKIAVGSGKLFGKGFRKGTQSQLNFLPERHTDFIYSVLSEEHGFIGSITTLSLFIILLLISVRIASQAREKFGALLVIGGSAIIFWHVFINIGMVIGMLPIVGVPLPILSYGGSMMLTSMMILGIVSSVSMRKYIF